MKEKVELKKSLPKSQIDPSTVSKKPIDREGTDEGFLILSEEEQVKYKRYLKSN